jgi:RNA polymerase sigma factor for flagellar operon FliA
VGLALGYILEDSGMYRGEDAAGSGHQLPGGGAAPAAEARARARGDASERERLIVRSHYLHLVPFESIADMMGISKGRVSQLHRRAMEMLREETRKVRKCDIAW